MGLSYLEFPVDGIGVRPARPGMRLLVESVGEQVLSASKCLALVERRATGTDGKDATGSDGNDLGDAEESERTGIRFPPPPCDVDRHVSSHRSYAGVYRNFWRVALVLGGVAQPAGTYGGRNSNGLITGSGRLKPAAKR